MQILCGLCYLSLSLPSEEATGPTLSWALHGYLLNYSEPPQELHLLTDIGDPISCSPDGGLHELKTHLSHTLKGLWGLHICEVQDDTKLIGNYKEGKHNSDFSHHTFILIKYELTDYFKAPSFGLPENMLHVPVA